MLCLRARIEAHDEVVAGVVGNGVQAERLWEEEGAPVGQAADDAGPGEDEGAGCFGYSGGGVSREVEEEGDGDEEEEDVLFYFCELAGPYLVGYC
jgi:hypothetical protein